MSPSQRLRATAALALAGLSVVTATEAQQTSKPLRLGIVSTGDTSSPHLLAEFHRGLRDLGYVEGQNLTVELRGTRGDPARSATDIVRLNPDVIVATTSATASAAKRATSTIPILMVSGDPIADGLIGSLSRPGANVTGVSTLASDIIGKQVELLAQAVPGLARVAILSNPDNPFHPAQIKEAESAIQALGAQSHVIRARGAAELTRAFADIATVRAHGLLVLSDGPVFLAHRKMIVNLAATARLPTMHPRREHVEAGGLIAYGTDRRALYYRLASYVDKIAKGAKPGDLPVEQPTTFELVVNLTTAKSLGLTLPPSLLQRADHVLK